MALRIDGVIYQFGDYLAKDNVEAYTPDSDYEPATKLYVDQEGMRGVAVFVSATEPSSPETNDIWIKI